MFAQENSRQILTVSELVGHLKAVVSETFPTVWVRGEITQIKSYGSGHAYPTLKDAEAQLSCALFKGTLQNLKFKLEEGMSVIALGRLDVYAPRGSCQFVIQALEPDGVGALQMAFEQLKKKLALEGLFDSEKKLSLPFLPRRVGLITSWHGAALHDMVTVIRRRFVNMDLLIYPVSVQGQNAAREIVQALQYFSLHQHCDVVIVGRGGGSLEDLWTFNEESVARAIAASTIPVISAVGHETDFTIADFVADVRAPTPTAAANLCVPEKISLLASLSSMRARLLAAQNQKIANCRNHLKLLWRALPTPQKVYDNLQFRLGFLTDRLFQSVVLKLRLKQHALREWQLRLPKPDQQIQRVKEKLLHSRELLAKSCLTVLQNQRYVLQKQKSALLLLSPHTVLRRGYVLVKKSDGVLVSQKSMLHDQDRLQLIFQDGVISAVVKKDLTHE